MTTNFFLFSLLLISSLSYSQIGINTVSPESTLQVVGYPSDISKSDGIIAPKISRANLIAKTAYTTNQAGAIIYVTDLTGTTNSSTAEILEIGYYFFNGNVWKSMNNDTKFSYGDIKTGIQTTDHNGWVKLDGRLTSTLTLTQQAQATTLGIGTNLADLTHSITRKNTNNIVSITATASNLQSAGGQTFTVTESGIYKIYINLLQYQNGYVNITVNLRQGTTVLATDSISTYQNDQRLPFDFFIEKQLIAGTIYNINATGTNGNFLETPRISRTQLTSDSINEFIYLGN